MKVAVSVTTEFPSNARLSKERCAAFGSPEPQASEMMTGIKPRSTACRTVGSIPTSSAMPAIPPHCYLKERPCRYSELRRLVASLSDKMLTERLRDLTRAGLVVRRRVGISSLTQRYALTEKARSLNAVLQHLYAWGVENADQFGVRVGQPLQELAATGTASARLRVVRRPLGARELGRT